MRPRAHRLRGVEPAGARFLRLLHTAFRPGIVRRSLRVSLVVGTALNLINQGERWSLGQGISELHVALNYLVPYLVASYSAALATMPDHPGRLAEPQAPDDGTDP